MATSNQQIIQYLKANDARAIRLLYDNYADSLYGVVLQMLRDEAAAKDVLQDSFIKVWKNAQRYDSKKATLFTWLLRITRNTALDYLRAKKTRSDHEIQSTSSDVYDMIEQMYLEHIDVPTHLSRLEPKYGIVLHALFFLGLSQQETSKKLDIPLGTVKSRLRVGLRKLRKIYQEKAMTVSPLAAFLALIFS